MPSMRRVIRISLISLAGLLILATLVVVVGIEILRSDWFFGQVRQRIVAEIEKSTGGKVELRELHFDWSTLIAEADGLVVHGTEPPGEAPLLTAAKVTIGLKLISLAERKVDVASIDIFEPHVNLLISADGRTNVPEPKTPPSTKSIDQTILDLAVARFAVQNGTVKIQAAGMPPKILPWTVHGEKLQALLNYGAGAGGGGPSYSGDISVQPLHGVYAGMVLDAAVELAVKFERDHVQVNKGTLRTESSRIEFSGDVRDLAAPQISGKYTAHLAAHEVERLLAWRTAQRGVIDSSGDFHFRNAGDYLVSGQLQATELTYRDPDLHFDHVQIKTNFYADPKKIEMTNMNASLLGGHVGGRVTLTNLDRFDIKGTLVGFGATALANLLQTTPPPFDALIAGPFEARGSITGVKDRRVDASAQLTLSPAGASPVNGFVDAHYDGARQYVDLGKSFLSLPNTRADFSGGLGGSTRSLHRTTAGALRLHQFE